ncbi:hypothetical protein DVH24_004376 [Malus domestica]|uniref:Delta-1-pyrroline-5-carboxylate synthase n=1 Tax=Malus domestica TaxID=3750 RepID=A0A498IEA2_MALDO|nr:hypothetical protein DVH24_004376 [Malus domestica]
MDSVDPTRAFIKNVKRIVVKVGTAVVTRGDGRLALGRLGALCEQLKDINSQGYEVILVTSGAVGLGRQRLRYRRLANSSFADLQNPENDFDGKACAAVGQISDLPLVTLTILAFFKLQLDVTSSQLLVTDSVFRDEAFRKQLSETVKSLLKLRVIPIFNENDAVSTRKAPYEDSSGIFWDNDSLAGLLALELKADLLVLLSDVEGLYSGPPTDPKSKLIHTYVKEKHQGEITFGDKSRVGRGGMTAKVNAAVCAAYGGIPVVITSGYDTDNIKKVLRGDRIGTVFHQDAHLWTVVKEEGARDMAVAAQEASRQFRALGSQERRKILLKVADALEANEGEIIAANEADVATAQEVGYEKALISRLALKPGKISALAKSVRKLADMEEPIGRVLKKTELAEGLVLEKLSCPLGVLLVVFESRPDALVQFLDQFTNTFLFQMVQQIAALAIQSRNGLLLKGGKEAKRSNAILHKVITSAIPEPVGGKLIGLVNTRDEIPDLLKLDDVIDLVIPRGSNKLVSKIKESTKIPVLGHADGICHVYVDKSANLDMAKRIVLDAKLDYPAACNAMETLLVHKDLLSDGGFKQIISELKDSGVSLYGGPRAATALHLPETDSFHYEYSSLACSVEIVDDVNAAIDHIHEHGSAHTDCIVTEDGQVAEVFLTQVDSAAVFHNVSTRFCDGARFGLGAEVSALKIVPSLSYIFFFHSFVTDLVDEQVGISTSRIHARGPVGVEGLLTTRWILRGNGQIVDADRGVEYTHKDLLSF